MSVSTGGGRAASRTDLYTAIHKSLRQAVFELAFAAGKMDIADTSETRAFAEALARVVGRLRAHSEHEDRFLHPVLRRHAPDVERRLALDHAAHEQDLAALFVLWDECRAEATATAALNFYRELSRFAMRLLRHLDEEERALEVLWDRASEQELARVMAEFRKSRTPDEVLADLELTLPALSHGEQVATLRSLAASAPEQFTRVRELVERVLDPAARRKLFAALDS